MQICKKYYHTRLTKQFIVNQNHQLYFFFIKTIHFLYQIEIQKVSVWRTHMYILTKLQFYND